VYREAVKPPQESLRRQFSADLKKCWGQKSAPVSELVFWPELSWQPVF
jgi:hypothetical protein